MIFPNVIIIDDKLCIVDFGSKKNDMSTIRDSFIAQTPVRHTLTRWVERA